MHQSYDTLATITETTVPVVESVPAITRVPAGKAGPGRAKMLHNTKPERTSVVLSTEPAPIATKPGKATRKLGKPASKPATVAESAAPSLDSLLALLDSATDTATVNTATVHAAAIVAESVAAGTLAKPDAITLVQRLHANAAAKLEALKLVSSLGRNVFIGHATGGVLGSGKTETLDSLLSAARSPFGKPVINITSNVQNLLCSIRDLSADPSNPLRCNPARRAGFVGVPLSLGTFQRAVKLGLLTIANETDAYPFKLHANVLTFKYASA